MAVKKEQTTILTGIIIPADWNNRHEVIGAALATADEKEYRIGGNKKGRELLNLLQRQVEVIGSIDLDGKGRTVITVKRYIVK
ncbi:MAG: hypothetical protein KKF28_04825 [Proteobacteria bacterium]|nr:hypothetical protein [Pseudomonadota bacterium]MBU3932666.1 hypothetical protein [Pseudomonadota bacterium]MBU4074697.1 hypothetical protein [Pseudomonadota bacterium]